MLDGFFLSFLIKEIKNEIINKYVDKVYVLSKDELVLYFRNASNNKLMLNINSNYARICLIDEKTENPSSPTMFCMLVRKYLNNAKLINIEQYNFDRVIFMDFETSNEIGDKIVVRLVIEIMGRYSNIILLDQTGMIIDSIKRVNSSMSRVRQILPKLKYSLLPGQDKLNILKDNLDDMMDKVLSYNDLKLSESLVKTIRGMSPLIAKEISYRVSGNINFEIKDVDKIILKSLSCQLNELKNIIIDGGAPFIFLDSDKNIKYFSFMKISHLKEDFEICEKTQSFTELINKVYNEKSNKDRINQSSKDMIHNLNNILNKLENKLELQKKEKINCQEKEKIQQCAILLQSNLHLIKKNDDHIILENFFDENKKIKINLDKNISGPENAQKYFKKYKKMCVADKILDELIKDTENEIIYIESAIDNINRTESMHNLEQIELELQKEGYLKKKREPVKKEKIKSPLNSVLKFKSDDGFDILVGNNGINNDWLTLKYANKNDIWLHTQKIPGAHVLIRTNNKEVSEKTLEQAAKLAVKNSKAKNSNLVPVDYTLAKNIKKYKGAKPGMVIYENHKTIIVKNK